MIEIAGMITPVTAHDGGSQLWGYNPVEDDRSDFTQSRPLYADIGPHEHVISIAGVIRPVTAHGGGS